MTHEESIMLSTELKRIYLLMEHGELALAREHMQKVEELFPDEPLVFALKGSIEIAAGELDASLVILRAAARRWPEDPSVQIYLAEAYLFSRKLSQAKRKVRGIRTYLESLSEEHPQYSWLNMARELEQLCISLEPAQIPQPVVSTADERAS